MEIYDIIMLVILVGAMLFGAIKGFAWQLASIASIVASYIVAYQVSRTVQPIDSGRSTLESILGDADSLRWHITGDLGRIPDDQRHDRSAETARV